MRLHVLIAVVFIKPGLISVYYEFNKQRKEKKKTHYAKV